MNPCARGSYDKDAKLLQWMAKRQNDSASAISGAVLEDMDITNRFSGSLISAELIAAVSTPIRTAKMSNARHYCSGNPSQDDLQQGDIGESTMRGRNDDAKCRRVRYNVLRVLPGR